jgi:hypothetical protein
VHSLSRNFGTHHGNSWQLVALVAIAAAEGLHEEEEEEEEEEAGWRGVMCVVERKTIRDLVQRR